MAISSMLCRRPTGILAKEGSHMLIKPSVGIIDNVSVATAMHEFQYLDTGTDPNRCNRCRCTHSTFINFYDLIMQMSNDNFFDPEFKALAVRF